MSVVDANSPQYLVYEALQLLCSQDTSVLKSAEAKLTQWEVQSGFYTTITQVIFAYQHVDTNVRWMATVYLKNGITKYWRRNATNGIKEEEKSEVKRLILAEAFREPVPQVATQMAVLIGSISRYDYPQNWVELMPRLNEIISSMDSLEQHRGLLILQEVVKSLASKRLRNDRRVFKELSTELYPCVYELWHMNTQRYLQSLDDNANTEISHSYLEKAMHLLRILRKITIFGIVEPRQSEPCAAFMNSILPCLNKLVEYRVRLRDAERQQFNDSQQSSMWSKLIELTEKFILKSMKILNEFSEMHSDAFIDYLSNTLEFTFSYVFYTGTGLIFDTDNQINFPTFAISCINLMKQIATKSPPEDESPIRTELKKKFFTSSRLTHISEKVITYYFLMTPRDIELWDDDAEQYSHDEAGESWKYDLRACTEAFYTSLFSQHRTDMVTDLMVYIRQAQENTLQADAKKEDILLKDAIYKATGISAFNLFDEVGFDNWFNGQLLEELSIPGQNFRILRRRIMWLIGQWTSVNLARENRTKVYEICLHLLRQEEDLCVRLTACKTLKNTLNDFEFESMQFIDFVQPTFLSLFTLLKEVKECETKMSVLNVMSACVEKMGDRLANDAESLCQYLPILWHESADHNMLRCAVLSALLQVIIAVSDIPSFLVPFVYPVITMTTNINEPSHIYFLEDALELWLAVVQTSTSLTPELLGLTNNLLPILENSSEHMRTVFSILQAYILLDAEAYLKHHGKAIVETCVYLMTDLRSEGVVIIVRLYDSILRTIGPMGIELLRPALPEVFRCAIANNDYHTIIFAHLSIVGRVLLLNQMAFIQILQELNIPNPFEEILDVWIQKMRLIGELDKRKLLSLALASLLPVQNDTIYHRYDVIIQALVESLNDIMKEDLVDSETNQIQVVDALVLTQNDEIEKDGMFRLDENAYRTHHYDRSREMHLKDPVHTIDLLKYVDSQLSQAKISLGDERFTTLMSTVDSSVISNLRDYNIEVLKIDAVA